MINYIKYGFGIIIIVCIIVNQKQKNDLRIQNQELKIQNQELMQTKQTQENVITITDENKEKNKKLESDINTKVSEVKAKLLAKNQEDFLNKSACIFSNFGNKEYDCK